MDGPETPGSALLSMWKLNETEVSCDLCPRVARFALFAYNKDQYLCQRHTIKVLETMTWQINTMRHAA